MTDKSFLEMLDDIGGNAPIESSTVESSFRCDGQFETAADASAFILAGNATVTLVSKKTGLRFTYKVGAPKDRDTGKVDLASDFRFVSVLNGPDNWQNYAYFGYIRRGVFFHGGAKARVGTEAPSAKAWAYSWGHIAAGMIPASLEVWHEGKCGRCGRKLTVPESIRSGFGPECQGKIF